MCGVRCSRESDRHIGEMSEINNEADLALNLGVRRRRSSGASQWDYTRVVSQRYHLGLIYRS
jgi:hypothetical protein